MAENDRDTGVPGFRINADDTSPLSGAPPRKGGRSEPDWNVDADLPRFRRWEEDYASAPEPLPGLRVGTPRPETHGYGRGRFLGTLAIAIVACAIGAGVGLSWPQLQERFLSPRPAEASRIEVSEAAVAPAPLEPEAPVPESRVAEAPEAAPPAPPAQPAPAAERTAPPVAVATRPPAPVAERAEAPSAVAETARDASATVRAPPSGACAEAGTLGGQLGCDDPAVEAAHRRMESAYRLALESGASPDRLSADQARWLALRDRAAQTSRGALITAYQLRIQELVASAGAPD